MWTVVGQCADSWYGEGSVCGQLVWWEVSVWTVGGQCVHSWYVEGSVCGQLVWWGSVVPKLWIQFELWFEKKTCGTNNLEIEGSFYP